jgi:pSer/pThr/pTyr-binding forkhead associated (FHA) protein
MSERSFAPSVAPELVLTFDGADRTLRPASYRVGRDPEADIVVIDSRVSWNHAVLQADGDAWFVEDCGSRNGTFVGSDRVDRFEIDGQCIVRLGSADDGPALICAVSTPHLGPGRRPDSTFRPSREDLRPTVVLPGPARVLHIGRADDNDVVIDDLSVSRHHADLRNTGHGFEIIDLGSRNGTFLNGNPVLRSVVTERDLVGIGPATFRLVGGELQEFLDQGDVSLVARDLAVRDGKQVRLDQVSFPIGERSLVAVIGPSGAGKSTLLHALPDCGPRPRAPSAITTATCTLIAANRGFLAMLVLMPVVLGLLVRLCAGNQGLRGPVNTSAETTLLMLVIIAAVTSVVSSARGLIEERDMYRRERMAGLSAGTYLLSKVVVLGFVVVIQAALLVLAGLATARLPGHGALSGVPPLAELIVDLAVFSVTSMALGLLVSALVGSQDLALLVGILLAIGQVMLTGAVLPLLSWPVKVLGSLFPARWGFAAIASTRNLNAIQPRGVTTDSFWAHTPSSWLRAVGVQLMMTAVFALVAWWRLIQISPGRTARR